MWRKIKILRLPPLALGTILLLFVGMFALGYGYVHAEKPFMPGDTSAMSPNNTPLEGYVSHADFEQECTHCHAPLHCVTDTKCQDCHADIAQERVNADGLHGKLPGTEKCQTCHPEHHGRDAIITQWAYANVDHYKLSGFSLALHQLDFEGKPMDCESCHSQDRFASQSLDCLTCHIENDHDTMVQNLETYGSDCTRCHDGVDRMSNWDHSQVYVLDGAHAELECQACHAEKVFEGVSHDCVACHADPELHAGKFGNDCARCHTAFAWQPAMLTRHNFELTHGSQEQLECQTCHLENFTEQTCYNCHDHTPEQMAQVHQAEGIEEYEDCGQCHPTGVSGEAARLLELYGDFSLIPDSMSASDYYGVDLPQSTPDAQEVESQWQQWMDILGFHINPVLGSEAPSADPGELSGS